MIHVAVILRDPRGLLTLERRTIEARDGIRVASRAPVSSLRLARVTLRGEGRCLTARHPLDPAAIVEVWL